MPYRRGQVVTATGRRGGGHARYHCRHRRAAGSLRPVRRCSTSSVATPRHVFVAPGERVGWPRAGWVAKYGATAIGAAGLALLYAGPTWFRSPRPRLQPWRSPSGPAERRRCSSILGPADAVLTMWDRLRWSWGRRGREVRSIAQPPDGDRRGACGSAGPAGRRYARRDRAAAAGIGRHVHRGGRRVASAADGGACLPSCEYDLVTAGRAFARFEDGQVVFKAEVGAVTPDACQVQGRLDPSRAAGQGLCAGGMAAVVEMRRDIDES